MNEIGEICTGDRTMKTCFNYFIPNLDLSFTKIANASMKDKGFFVFETNVMILKSMC